MWRLYCATILKTRALWAKDLAIAMIHSLGTILLIMEKPDIFHDMLIKVLWTLDFLKSIGLRQWLISEPLFKILK